MKRLLLPLLLGTALFHGEAYSAGHLWAKALPDYSQGYDEQRDPAQDLASATAKAQREGKKVLLLVGGEWCSWCKEMNHFLDREPALASHFVVVKVNVSKANKNEPFLKRYPEYIGVPHFYVLDAKGKLLESVNTGLLEKGKSYNEAKFGKFIAFFQPPSERS
ncbi:thioredoxin family protein [Aeromonas salmonicida]|uniref:thioredoxin family protein n=1 Tax=Aeromonas salmonicida TaxID=645 RepID=UPI0024A813AC|nr:thioredoxin family protein [Aeromonas salmonicida]MDM5134969.1 thioredoxin family protein [Aeromonas salmonicida]WHF41857.1 thioredoxin family protein [Aeromonas salmonicida]